MKFSLRVLLATLLLLGTMSTAALADGVPPPMCFPGDTTCQPVAPLAR